MNNHVSLTTLFSLVPWPVLLAWLGATGVPALSLLVSRRKGAWTGIVTIALSAVAGILGTINYDQFSIDWKKAILTAIVAWATARGFQSTVIANTKRLEPALLNAGIKPHPKPTAD